ncbi:HD domain-containing protein [Cladochytrium replicatum]|nr:HD domain-containing protein [Cladochytrium replicatum]
MESLLVLKAAAFAAEKHKLQLRKDNSTPYINHPIAVALAIAEAGVSDPATLQAALLHDTVEDTDTTIEELAQVFGDEVSSLVAEVTDDKSLPKDVRKRLQIEEAPSKSHKAKIVKLADKLANLRDLQVHVPLGWSGQRVKEYFEWAKKVTDGCKGTNEALEAALEVVYAQGTNPHAALSPAHPAKRHF